MLDIYTYGKHPWHIFFNTDVRIALRSITVIEEMN